MGLTIIQEKTFEQMLTKVAMLRDKFKAIAKPKEQGLEDWLDSQDVCHLLHISTRTLQTLRSNGSMPFSQLGGKYFYHRENVIKLVGIKKHQVK